jgi:hypothetical protein
MDERAVTGDGVHGPCLKQRCLDVDAHGARLVGEPDRPAVEARGEQRAAARKNQCIPAGQLRAGRIRHDLACFGSVRQHCADAVQAAQQATSH